MNDKEFEDIIYNILVTENTGGNELSGLGIHKKFKKFKKKLRKTAKKIVKKVKKVAIPAAKIGVAYVTGGGAIAAGALAAKMGADEVMRKKAVKAAKKAQSTNQAAIAAEVMAQENVAFNSPQSRAALNRYVMANQAQPSPMKYVIPAVGGAAVLMLLLNR